jgi:hypothetical protein
MAIKVGDKIPKGKFMVMKAEGPAALSTDELFGGKKVVVFSVAFSYATPESLSRSCFFWRDDGCGAAVTKSECGEMHLGILSRQNGLNGVFYKIGSNLCANYKR